MQMQKLNNPGRVDRGSHCGSICVGISTSVLHRSSGNGRTALLKEFVLSALGSRPGLRFKPANKNPVESYEFDDNDRAVVPERSAPTATSSERTRSPKPDRALRGGTGRRLQTVTRRPKEAENAEYSPSSDPDYANTEAPDMAADPASEREPEEVRPSMPVFPSIPVVKPGEVDKGTFFSAASFSKLGATQDVIAALLAVGISRPSHVQAAALKMWSSGAQHYVLADQAGSGKTLAYLLPLVADIRAREQASGRATTPNAPQAIIVTPTQELAVQVLRVCRALAVAGLPMRTVAMTGGQSTEQARRRALTTQVRALKEGVDVAILTPGRLGELTKRGNLSLAKCRTVVLDEVDVLMANQWAGEAFSQQLAALSSAGGGSARVVMATATLPAHIHEQIAEVLPGLRAAYGPGLHRTQQGVEVELVDCSGGDEVSQDSGRVRRLAALDQALKRSNAQRVIIFCNKIDECRRVENHLKRHAGEGVAVSAFHEAVTEDARDAALKRLLRQRRTQQPAGGGSGGPGGGQAGSGLSRAEREDLERFLLVCTDRMSRGLDSMFCEHVVLFDFPRDPSEYVRRVGRTGRGAGGKGLVTILALGKQVAFAKEIMEKAQRGAPLHRIPDEELALSA